jgi:hypothetical protein
VKRPNISTSLALKAAAAAAQVEPEAGELGAQTVETRQDEAPHPARGRPRGKRPVAARQTVYLDEARHAALVRLAEDRGRSVHSLIIEGIDHVVGKPTTVAWQ